MLPSFRRRQMARAAGTHRTKVNLQGNANLRMEKSVNMDGYSNVSLFSGFGKRDLGGIEPEDAQEMWGLDEQI